MCLSTVYKNKKVPEDILMNNVMRIECKDGLVVLTDLMERTTCMKWSFGRILLSDSYRLLLKI